MTLDEAILHCEEKCDCTECGMEHRQLANWLKTLREYYERDTPMKVTHISLAGKYTCPQCGELMALGVKKFCDVCGQALKI